MPRLAFSNFARVWQRQDLDQNRAKTQNVAFFGIFIGYLLDCLKLSYQVYICKKLKIDFFNGIIDFIEKIRSNE